MQTTQFRLTYYLAVATITALLGGCYSMVTSMAMIGVPTSKYLPVLTSESAVDEFVKLRDGYDGQVVSDTAGKHFSSRRGAVYEGFYLAVEDEAPLRNLMAGATGLLEPQWTYREDGTIQFNRDATRKRHDYLSKTLLLRLLPLEATEAFVAQLTAFAVAEKRRQAAGGTSVTVRDAFSGNAGLYNSRFFQGVVSKLAVKPDYMVLDPLTLSYFGSIGVPNDSPRTVSFYNGMASNLRSLTSLQLVPVSYFENLTTPGIRFFSGCGLFDPPAAKAAIADAKRALDVPFVSAIASASREKDPALLTQARANLAAAIGDYERRRGELDTACKAGLQAMQLSGALSSQRLK